MMSKNTSKHSSGRVSPTRDIKSKPQNFCECFSPILILISGILFVIVLLYNIIASIISVIKFSHNDVEAACPNSEIWWFVLFVGVIWPILAGKGTTENMSKEETTINIMLTTAFLYVIILTTLIVWAYDQLWGLPGFANDSCAMEHWQVKNTTEGADNDGHNLYTRVEWWLYIYLVVDIIIIMALCGIGGIVVIDNACPKTNQETEEERVARLNSILTGESQDNPKSTERRVGEEGRKISEKYTTGNRGNIV